MSILKSIVWHLSSDRYKLARLRREGLTIGTGCEVLNGFDFGSEPYLVRIGDNVRISAGVKVTTHDGGVWVLRNIHPELRSADRFGRVEIRDNCHIGMNAFIMPGVTIGRDCIVGACSVVTHDIPDGMVVAGVPARTIGTTEDYRNKHRKDFVMTKDMSWGEKKRFVEREL